VNAIIKKLSTKGLIKSHTSVLKGGKKVWMLLEIEPSLDVTGGMTGSDYFDIESVAVLMERVEAYTRK
jgi:RNA polymerase Rpc34 subunit